MSRLRALRTVWRGDSRVQSAERKLEDAAGKVYPVPSTPAPVSRAISGWWDEQIGLSSIDFPGKVIAKLSLSQGSYVVVAKLDVCIHVDANGSIGCRLFAGVDSDQAHQSWGRPRSNEGQWGNFIPQAMALNVVHTFDASGGDVHLQCWGRTARTSDGQEYPFFVQNIKITAIEVQHLDNHPLALVE